MNTRNAGTKQLAWALCLGALAAACGGNKGGDDDGPGPGPGSGSDVPLTSCTAPIAGTRITTRMIGRVTGAALLATSPPDDPRLFVLEQRGAIRIFEPTGALRPEPFLDLSVDAGGPVVAGGELGLLGLAFHPSYVTNGLFFIFYTTRQGGSPFRDVLARCRVGVDPSRADPATCVELLGIPDFASNHNGGMIEFGADGLLYVTTGDGGGAGDPNRNAQAVTNAGDTVALLGKMLRLDVDNKTPGKEYGIPADNPFAGGGGAPEIFMTGLRNAWRWSFDRETGDMWLADVGQDKLEELTALRPAQQKGANLGWSMFEADDCFRGPCDTGGKKFPQDVRSHASGWVSIIGGQVYRGACYPEMTGWYFYTDYSAHGLSRARLRADDSFEIQDLPGRFPTTPASIHASSNGELYLTDTAGNIFHIEAGP